MTSLLSFPDFKTLESQNIKTCLFSNWQLIYTDVVSQNLGNQTRARLCPHFRFISCFARSLKKNLSHFTSLLKSKKKKPHQTKHIAFSTSSRFCLFVRCGKSVIEAEKGQVPRLQDFWPMKKSLIKHKYGCNVLSLREPIRSNVSFSALHEKCLSRRFSLCELDAPISSHFLTWQEQMI